MPNTIQPHTDNYNDPDHPPTYTCLGSSDSDRPYNASRAAQTWPPHRRPRRNDNDLSILSHSYSPPLAIGDTPDSDGNAVVRLPVRRVRGSDSCSVPTIAPGAWDLHTEVINTPRQGRKKERRTARSVSPALTDSTKAETPVPIRSPTGSSSETAAYIDVPYAGKLPSEQKMAQVVTFTKCAIPRKRRKRPSPSSADVVFKESRETEGITPAAIEIFHPSRPVSGGGYCDLFKGRNTLTGLQIALKRPRFCTQEAKSADDAKRRFRREGKIWATLVHVNILRFLGMVDIAGEIYLVSPWLEHGDLSKFVPARLRFLELSTIQRSSDPSRIAFEKFDEGDIILGFASGLTYLHEKNIIHGDMKAANVLLDSQVRPTLCDFGMTRVLDEAYSMTSTAMQGAGSMRWMSPERLNNDPRTQEGDMYAFGMTIVEVRVDFERSLAIYIF
ncbi:hypothetical protein FRB93_010501 [Tulasnella sp. JGI-2019a]|nr:hypothetical protein FRB93_010501 [Tulasnella sp. JGI-2019a]